MIKARPRCSVGGIGLNDWVTGAYVHFVGDVGQRGQDFPCLGAGKCTLCPRGVRWKCWIPVWNPSEQRVYLLQLSEQAYYSLGDDVPEDYSLRGREIVVSRKTNNKRSEVVVDLQRLEKLHDVSELPGPFDIRRNLLRLWDWKADLRGPTINDEDGEILSSDVFNQVPY